MCARSQYVRYVYRVDMVDDGDTNSQKDNLPSVFARYSPYGASFIGRCRVCGNISGRIFEICRLPIVHVHIVDVKEKLNHC